MLSTLTKRDPDDALSPIAYVKGAWFLQFLEQRVGREVFDPFLRGWFDSHAFQKCDKRRFYRLSEAVFVIPRSQCDYYRGLDSWLNAPGIPGNCSEELRSLSFRQCGWCTYGLEWWWSLTE